MNDEDRPRTSAALWGWSVFTIAWALLLLFAGAAVTTTRSGDAIPTWPEPLFPRDFSTPALIEWTHRGVAAWMGIFTLVLAAWTQRREKSRPRVRHLGWSLVALVLVQAVVGGLRVLFVADGIDATPTWLKVLHAVTGQAFFCALVAHSTVLAPSWRKAVRRDLDPAAMGVMRGAILSLVLLLVQLVLGALARHGVVAREVHAFFALVPLVVVARLVLVGSFDVAVRAHEIRRAASLLGVLAAAQIALGLVTYFVAATGGAPEQRTPTQVVLVNLHLAVGAAMLGTTLSILMRAVHVFGVPTDERVEAAERAASGSAS